MHSLFWQLGGPARFVERVADEIREGRNVVVCLPEHAPHGLAGAVREVMGDGCGCPWHVMSLDGELGSYPAQWLASRVVPNIPTTTVLNACALANDDGFAGRVIWLRNVGMKDWPAWQDFLVEYSHACRARSLMERTILCVAVVGRAATCPPAEDVCLACHMWRGVVDSLDMILYCSNLLRDRNLPIVRKRVLIAVVAGLALWDPAVAEELASAEIDAILEPRPILNDIGCRRGWSPEVTLDGKEGWCLGLTDTIDGEEKLHSAAISLRDSSDEIRRRIWSAEVGVLFPYVEEQRQAILRRLGGLLRVPFETRFGEIITDWRDLEIGHIESQIVTNGISVGRETRRMLRQLREIRNCLAHQEVVPKNLLLGDALA